MTRAAALALLLAGCASLAHAHDSWFERGDGGSLALVTGTRYPRADLVLPPESVEARACEGNACWAELHEFDVSLDPQIVDVYFREAQPPQSVRERWKALRAQGIDWHERYRKFMRVQLAPGAAPGPAGLDLEIVPRGDTSPATGSKARFALFAQGRPVNDQPVELVSERNPLGLWSRTDANGEVEWTLPFSGEWLVRTIVIEPDGDTAWRSRFATLVFDAR